MMNKMRKMKNKKGFTLMEMLIVVAIIAILIAIAIPTFASSLNKARVATDEANIRAGYASVMADVLMNENDKTATTGATNKVYTLKVDGSVDSGTGTGAAAAYECKGNNDATVKVGGVDVGAWKKGNTVSYTYNYQTGKVEIKVNGTSSTPEASSSTTGG